jgi:riboflavin biosynthesis pyrimidine reductase
MTATPPPTRNGPAGTDQASDQASDQPTVRRVHPAPHEPVSIREAYTVEREPHGHRPWVGLCMVTSLDGTVAVDGTSGRLGNPNDLQVLLTLRSITDVIIVGAGTVRGEGYGPPKKSGQRIGVVTNRGSVDLDDELFTSGAGFVIAPESADIDEDRVEVLRAGRVIVDLAAAIGRLSEIVPEVSYVQAEGGPTLNAALLEADLIDELDLTIASRLSGGEGPRLTSGAETLDRRFDVAHLLVDDDGFVFGRWTRRR